MHIPRLLLLSLLVPVFIAPVSAQSSPDKKPVSSRPLLDGLTAPPEFRAHVLPLPPLPTILWTRIRDIQPQLSFDPTLAQNDAVCLSIRTYRVVRDNPKSDSTRPAGYSECQPAARYQLKTAVDSQELVLR
jgi:hypothetical protein